MPTRYRPMPGHLPHMGFIRGMPGAAVTRPAVSGPPCAAPPTITDTTVRIEDLSTVAAALLVKPLVGRVGLEPTTGGL
jgi:hypothetical protein